MVRIRLRRVGAKRQPSYRIVVADSRSPRDGRYIEKIGFYNPRTEPATMTLDEARALYWLSQGAQPSDAVVRIMNKLGTTGRFERFRTGEDMEMLVAEAEAEAAARPPVDPRTRRDDLLPGRQAKAAKKAEAPEESAEPEAAQEAAQEVAQEAAPEAVAEGEVDAVVEAEVEAAAETEDEAAEDAELEAEAEAEVEEETASEEEASS
jgi:small subunit ribosomal protein S16